VNVALITGQQERIELRQCDSFAVNRRPLQRPFATQPAQIAVRVRRLRGPDRFAEEAEEIEDRRALARDRAVHATRPNHRQQVLVDEFLLEILEFLPSAQSRAGAQRADRRQTGHYVSSPDSITRQVYQVSAESRHSISESRAV
jgi:hypothetical protein